MSALAAAFRELAGLFVEDGALALAIVVVVVIACLIAMLAPAAAWASGAILLFGCLAALVANVMMARRR